MAVAVPVSCMAVLWKVSRELVFDWVLSLFSRGGGGLLWQDSIYDCIQREGRLIGGRVLSCGGGDPPDEG